MRVAETHEGSSYVFEGSARVKPIPKALGTADFAPSPPAGFEMAFAPTVTTMYAYSYLHLYVHSKMVSQEVK